MQSKVRGQAKAELQNSLIVGLNLGLNLNPKIFERMQLGMGTPRQ